MGVVRLAQVRQACLGGGEGPAHVDLEHQVEALDLEVAHGGEVDGAGVVHHDVHAAEVVGRLGHGAIHGVRVAHVTDDRERPASRRLDLRGGGVNRALELRMGLVGLRQDRHVRALPGQLGGDREADPPAAPRHEDGTSLDRAHTASRRL